MIWPTFASATTKTPTFTSDSLIPFTEGSFHSFTVTVVATSSTVLRWSGAIPVGLTFIENGDGMTATIAGSPSVGSDGIYPVKIVAVDRTGNATTQDAQIV